MRRAQDQNRMEITIATFLRGESENAFTREIEAEGIPIEIVCERGALDSGVIPRMRALLDRVKPDIVWTHAVKSHFLVRAAGLHKRAHWVASHHGYTTTDFKTRAYNELDRWSHRGAERVITVCHKFARDLETRGVRADRIRVQHNPIRANAPASADAASALRDSLGITGAGARVLLSVGRLSREKGHADLIRAMALLCPIRPDPLRLVMVGHGPELPRLQALAAQLGIADQIIFAGHRADVRPYYGNADLFVLPSHSEGSPNVLLEAMDAGVPIVATCEGGIPEIVTDRVSALLVPSRRPEPMAQAIAQLLNSPSLREELTRNARLALGQHTPEMYFRELRTIFEEVARP